MPHPLTLVATTAMGLESLATQELRELGYEDARASNGKVTFQGDWRAVARTNTWLRTAERVLIEVGQFPARTFDELFDGVKALPWEEFLPADACFPVEGKSHESKLSSVPACQGVTKKAIVEALKRRHALEKFPETGARHRILVALHKDVATLTLDTTGVGLHKRGYRELTAAAPLRETLAAALVMLSRWDGDRYFEDPLCGSGTLPIEAALLARRIAPGLSRTFEAMDWPVVPKEVWTEAEAEARDLIRHDVELRGIHGSDLNGEVLSLARHHARKAGVEQDIQFEKKAIADFQTKRKYGVVVTNPPYGERLGEAKEVEELYRTMGRVFAPLDTWSFFVLTAHPDFERHFGRTATKKRKLYNGNLRCDLYQYFGPLPPRRATESPSGGPED